MACYLLFQMYSKGEGVEMNQGEAFRWDFRAAEAGLAISQSHVGNYFYKVRNYPRALSWFRRAAEQGDRDAECNLGIMHFYGHGVLANPEEGEKWILKAADRGDITAASMMGIIYAHQERYSEAMEYCRKAVDDRIAEYHIGCFYRYGLGILPDYSAAMEWFERSAQKEYSLAEFAIAQMFYEGHGVKRDLEKVKDLKKIESLGNARVAFALGTWYHLGFRVTKDEVKAQEYFMKAANLGDREAQYNVGFSRGRYIQDDTLAYKWFLEAANQGHADAAYSVGYMHQYGRGANQSYEEAEKWYLAAIDKGNVPAQ
ncbi:HCP-like protein, partial [Linnemannia elongata AG-77]